MRFLHLSDLHLGRILHRFSLQEEQTEILEVIRQIAAEQKPDAILIAGDVYDRGIPPVYATQMLDTFLTGLQMLEIPVMIISGNHDSAERLAFLSGPLRAGNIWISPAYRGSVKPITLYEADGSPVDIWLLPYLRPATVRSFHPDETIESTNDAVECAIRHMDVDPSRRNVLAAHQFVSGAQLSGSEESCSMDLSVGGTDMVEASVFTPFDYVALGHLHRAQNVAERIRYCGTPLKYSYSELRGNKSVTLAQLDADRALTINAIPLPEPRRMQEIRGAFDEITSVDSLRNWDRDAYTHIILTDDMPIPDVMNHLRQYFPNITHLDWDNKRTRSTDDFSYVEDAAKHTPLSLFAEFFERSNGAAMNDEQQAYVQSLIRSIWEEQA